MNFFNEFRLYVIRAIEDLSARGVLSGSADSSRIAVDPPRDPAHGDVTTNAAMVLAKSVGMKPRDLADLLVERLQSVDAVVSAEVAGPGFINLRLGQAFWYQRLGEILQAGTDYGTSDAGAGRAINVEFVSANPTGPLHVGHGRGAVVGDALASLLEKVGYSVCREFYVNDAGGQVDKLAAAVYWRYLQALGDRVAPGRAEAFATDMAVEYRGDYLTDVGQSLVETHGTALLDMVPEQWLPLVRRVAVEAMMRLIEDDLKALGVHFQTFSSERSLVDGGRVDEALRFLEEGGMIYTGILEPPKGKLPDDWEPRPQMLFRSSRFGDDVDRPIRKAGGSWTYFASDIAYHLDKYRRGFEIMIDVWGADHGGYVKRMQAAVAAVSEGRGQLDVKLCQMVNLLDGGQPVKMSKRAGTFVTLREVLDRVGRDVFRFIMLTRKNDAQLDFDFQKVTEQSRENPVFYVQYAHARCCSVLRLATAGRPRRGLDDRALSKADLGLLTDPGEIDLIKLMAGWPRLVESAADAHEPHRIAFYLQDLAAMFHLHWTRGKDESTLRFLDPDNEDLTFARLALVRGVQLVIASGLRVIGVEPVEELR